MSRENCSCCNPCKGINKIYCDNCSANCCTENMKKHQEIFYLGDQFGTKVNYAENELCTKSNKVRENIDKICNINISGNCDSLYSCENFFNSMKNVYNELDYKKYEFNNKIKQNQKKLENEKKNLMNDYNQKLKNLNDIFDNEKINIKNEMNNDNKKKEEKMNNLKNSKNILEEEKIDILSRNVDKIVIDYINGEKTIIENNYQNEKNSIDEKNQLVKQNFEFTEQEKALESYYLNTINNIKNYSQKIPYFDNWIQVYNLNKYLN